MKWTNYIIQGFSIWIIQILLSDLLSIDTVRPDFIVMLVLYWSIRDGRTVGVIGGFILGLMVDLSGASSYFGLSPMIYSTTGYLSGYLKGAYLNLNPFYFTASWVGVICLHFIIFCFVFYQDIWFINPGLYWAKWIGTSLYTLSFLGIIQIIYPLHRLD